MFELLSIKDYPTQILIKYISRQQRLPCGAFTVTPPTKCESAGHGRLYSSHPGLSREGRLCGHVASTSRDRHQFGEHLKSDLYCKKSKSM